MGLITGLLTLPVSGPIYGLRFILEQIREQALAEMLTEEQIESLLIESSLRHQAGEITDEEYAELETNLLEALNTRRMLQSPEYEVPPDEFFVDEQDGQDDQEDEGKDGQGR